MKNEYTYEELAGVIDAFAKKGLLARYEKKYRQEGEQRGRLEGRQEGQRNILEFLEKGHSLEEAKKEFALM